MPSRRNTWALLSFCSGRSGSGSRHPESRGASQQLGIAVVVGDVVVDVRSYTSAVAAGVAGRLSDPRRMVRNGFAGSSRVRRVGQHHLVAAMVPLLLERQVESPRQPGRMVGSSPRFIPVHVGEGRLHGDGGAGAAAAEPIPFPVLVAVPLAQFGLRRR